MSEPLPSIESARAAFHNDNNIAIGFGRILYSNGSWRLPSGRTTTNREWKDFDDSDSERDADGTYTIACHTESGMLIAIEPDGADIDAAIAEVEEQGGVKFAPNTIIKESGLVLTDEPRDDDDVRMVSCNGAVGFLAAGDRTWDYAVRRPS